MDLIALALVLGGSLALLFGIPFGIAWYVYQKMKQRGTPFYWRWIAIVPALVLLYLMGKLFFPEEHSYKMDYWEVTAYPFPSSSRFVYQDTLADPGAPGFDFGMETSLKNFVNKLDVLKRRGFSKDSLTPYPAYLSRYLQDNKLHPLHKLKLSRYPRFDYYVDFLSDSSTIFFRKIPK